MKHKIKNSELMNSYIVMYSSYEVTESAINQVLQDLWDMWPKRKKHNKDK